MLPEDIIGRALDAIGADIEFGSLEDGSREARVCLRAYMPALEQIHCAAHWNECRKMAPLVMLGDATGNTPNVGTQVVPPWTYEYIYPDDCMKARFVPLNGISQQLQPPAPAGNISLPTTPQTSVGQPPTNTGLLVPTRFSVSTDFNYPAQVGLPAPGTEGVEWWNMRGVGPDQRTVVLSNVNQASLVYTAFIPYPNMWDSLFQEAVVALIASMIALPLSRDKKFGLAMRDHNIAIAREKLIAARIRDGNEGVTSTDWTPDWIRARNVGATGWNGNGWGDSGGGLGMLMNGWDSVAFPNGSAF